MTLQPEEENLRERFEAMRSIVESPNQFRVRMRVSKLPIVLVSLAGTDQGFTVKCQGYTCGEQTATRNIQDGS